MAALVSGGWPPHSLAKIPIGKEGTLPPVGGLRPYVSATLCFFNFFCALFLFLAVGGPPVRHPPLLPTPLLISSVWPLRYVSKYCRAV